MLGSINDDNQTSPLWIGHKTSYNEQRDRPADHSCNEDVAYEKESWSRKDTFVEANERHFDDAKGEIDKKHIRIEQLTAISMVMAAIIVSARARTLNAGTRS